MAKKRISFAVVALSLFLAFAALARAQSVDSLPSWNNGKAKQSIIEFVATGNRERLARLCATRSAHRCVRQRRHAVGRTADVFPGPLRARPCQGLAPQHPEWKDKEPFASLLKGDVKGAMAGGMKSVLEIIMATHAGMTTEEFETIVRDWIATAKHPTTKRPYTEMVYQPMLEVLAYLRANGFKTFIVSGGGIEFMRPWSEKVYGVPPEQVIGSSIKVKFEMREGTPVLVRLPELDFFDDKEGKPVAIHQQIGRRPIAAFGNSDGDLQMLQWTTAGQGPRFALYVHHTDAEREWAYDRKSSMGRLDKGLDEAKAKGWTVVNMKQDWKVIYPLEKRQQ